VFVAAAGGAAVEGWLEWHAMISAVPARADKWDNRP
jgi:hypothetical protein